LLALVAGIFVGAALSLGLDEILHVVKIYPPWGERISGGLAAMATAYRMVFNILGSYVIARLAPNRPMRHAMIGGALGFLAGAAGTVATWNRDLGPHWYSAAVALIALPCAWIGARIWERQVRARIAD
jgi:hypothetical protein